MNGAPNGRLGVAVFAALSAVACGASRHPEAEPLPAAPPPPAATAVPAEPPASDQNAEAVAAALERVAALRELPPERAVRSRTLSRAAITEHVEGHIAREVPRSVIDGSTALLVGLEVVPADFDYVASFLAFMSSEIAGLYEPDDDTMYLARDLDGPTRDMTLAHELVHALQDQHYDLGTLLDYAPGDGDRQTALHTLAEGDASSLMVDALLEPRGRTALDMPDAWMRMQALAGVELSPGVQDVPAVIRRSVIAPYVDGMAFVNALRRRGGWAAVDEAWRVRVASTEQILHPDKWAAREMPEIIAAPTAPDPAWTAVYTDVIGEQALRILFEEWMPAGTASEAASAWAGDRIAVFRAGADWLVLGHLRWDAVDAARRGHAALLRGAGAQGRSLGRREAEQAAGAAQSCTERPALGPYALMRRGRDVALVLGPFATRGQTATRRGTCVTAGELARRILDR